MAKFKIKSALGGGFGGTDFLDWEHIECESLEGAETWAYENACEEYDSMAGSHGLESEGEIAEENPDWSEADVWDSYVESRESWLEWLAEVDDD
jgi:hypothetical protein